MKKARLTQDQRSEIKRRLDAGETVAALAKEFRRTAPTIYRIRDESKSPGVSAITALEQEIARAESRIVDLQKQVQEIATLREEIKVKTAALESLKKLSRSPGD